MKTLLLALSLALVMTVARSEDWTIQGKTYANIKVTKIDTDAVHIMYDGGIGSINLADLTPELQQRFNYDPKAAAEASQQKAAQQAQSDAIAQQVTHTQQVQLDKKEAKHDAKRIAFLKNEIGQLKGRINTLSNKIYSLQRRLALARSTRDQENILKYSTDDPNQMQLALEDCQSKLGQDQSELDKLQPDTD